MKNTFILLSIIAYLFSLNSCSHTVSFDEATFQQDGKIKYNDNLLSGEVVKNHENGVNSKIMEVEKGNVLSQTHFSTSGDSIATMYYYPDGSFKKYVDKTIKNNIIGFECIVSDNDGICVGSKNLPDASYRLARIIDYWIEKNGLLDDYKQPPSFNRNVLTKPTGSARIGRILGKSTMLFSGSSISSVKSYDSKNFEELNGPFYADNIFLSVEYSNDGFNKEYFNENAELSWLSWNSRESIDSMLDEEDMKMIMRAYYNPVDGSSAGAMLYVYYQPGDLNVVDWGASLGYILISVQGANDNFVYQTILKDISFDAMEDLVTGEYRRSFIPPGYDYNNFLIKIFRGANGSFFAPPFDPSLHENQWGARPYLE